MTRWNIPLVIAGLVALTTLGLPTGSAAPSEPETQPCSGIIDVACVDGGSFCVVYSVAVSPSCIGKLTPPQCSQIVQIHCIDGDKYCLLYSLATDPACFIGF